MQSITELHNIIVNAWLAKEETTICRVIHVNTNGTVTICTSLAETTFNPNGSEASLRRFLESYVK